MNQDGKRMSSSIKVANAPCSWGSLEFDGMQGKGIGYPQMLDELVATGYVGTELGDWGFMPTDPEALRGELAQRDLTMVGAFVPVALRDPDAHAGGEAHALKVARLLAGVKNGHAPIIVLADDNGTDPIRTQNAGRITPQMGLNDTEWETFAAAANRIARTVREGTGLPTAFHHHAGGFVETPEEVDRLLELTDPNLVGLAFDTGHLVFGAGPDGCGAVEEVLERHADRIWHMHFKDCDPEVAREARREKWDYFEAVRNGLFCELGQGCVDFASVLEMLRAQDYDGWVVVEQDVLPGMGTPRESALRNRNYLKEVGI